MDHDSIEAELQRLHPDSFGWALACCRRDRDQADEVLQRTYLKVLDGSARFDGRSSFRTWLFGVVRRTAAERRRRGAMRNRVMLTLFAYRDETDQPASPHVHLEQDDRSRRLVRAMGDLSPRQAEVLQLAFYHEMTIEQAARVMGLSVGSARTHYTRGKQNLARALGMTEGAI
jgi:RNA polymerase sigma-70 factor (ECF subfamily)